MDASSYEGQYDDPIAHFTQRARELTAQRKAERENNMETLTLDMNATLETGTNDTRNVGYLPFKLLYKELQLDKFWNWKAI